MRKMKFDPKAIIEELKKDKKKAMMAGGGVIVVLVVLSLFVGDDGGSGGDPYAGLAQQPAAPSNAEQASSGGPAGISFDDMLANDKPGQGGATAGKNTKAEKKEPAPAKGKQAEAPAAPPAQKATTKASPKKVAEAKGGKPKMASQSSETLRRQAQRLAREIQRSRPATGEADIDTLVAQVDDFIREIIRNYDMKNIRGDALKGTTSEEERLRRIESLLDILTTIQTKRKGLLAATRDVRVARITPERLIEKATGPLKRQVSELSAMMADMQKKLDAMQQQVAKVQHDQGVAVANAGAAVAASGSGQTRGEDPMPSLLLVMADNGGLKANLSMAGRVYQVSGSGQSVGSWQVVDMGKTYVVVRGQDGRTFMLTVGGGSREVKMRGGRG